MTITPVEATLLGALVGAVASIVASALTQLALDSRERAHKLWERRADALEEIHRFTLARRRSRAGAMATKRLPDDWDPGRPDQPLPMYVLETKVALYAPRAVSQSHEGWTKALVPFIVAFSEWRAEVDGLSVSVGAEEAERQAADKWRTVELRAKEWEQAEDRLFKALRDASEPRPERRWVFRRSG